MQFIQAANHWVGREGQKPQYLIIHGTAGGSDAVGIANYFAQPATQASAHYVIGTDGTIVQCVQETDAAWSNGALTQGHDSFWGALNGVNPNLVSIAIEHCKPSTDNSDTLTPAQQTASFNLVRDICLRWNIPMRGADANGGITGHYSLDPVNRSRCPGPYPWDALFSFLSKGATDMLQLSDPFATAYFTGNDSVWNCKATGHTIIGGILNFYRQILGAVRLPTTGEQYDIPGIVYQSFEAGFICYDPQNKTGKPAGAGNCYLIMLSSDLGQKLTGLQAAKTQVTQLQNQLALSQSSSPVDQTSLKNALNAALSAINVALKSIS